VHQFFSGTIPSWSSNGPTMFATNGARIPISAMAFAPSNPNGLIYAYGTGWTVADYQQRRRTMD